MLPWLRRPSCVSEAVYVGRPSTFKVILPVGGALPCGGMPTPTSTVTVNGEPAVGVEVPGTTVSVVVLGSTVTTRGWDVTDLYVESPLYTATMSFPPMLSPPAILNVAIPLASTVEGLGPRLAPVVLSRNVTVPVGVAPPVPETTVVLKVSAADGL